MILAIIIVGTAFYWLGKETNWLRVRLLAYESIAEYDKRTLAEIDMEGQVKEELYQQWLEKQHKPKYRYGGRDTQVDYPAYEWMKTEEDLAKRRAGEMIYQR